LISRRVTQAEGVRECSEWRAAEAGESGRLASGGPRRLATGESRRPASPRAWRVASRGDRRVPEHGEWRAAETGESPSMASGEPRRPASPRARRGQVRETGDWRVTNRSTWWHSWMYAGLSKSSSQQHKPIPVRFIAGRNNRALASRKEFSHWDLINM
jgi:hypothetical protein